MAGIAAGGEPQPGPATKNLGRRRAAGIYGAIITAAILDTAGGHVSTAALVASVVVTLLVYWLAEEYAEVLGEQVQGGRLPSKASIWEALAVTWPMVTASYAPLLALVLAHLAGASDLTAANVGLAAAIVLLTVHGWLAGRAAQLLAARRRHVHCGRAGARDDCAQGPGPDPPALKIGPVRTRAAGPLTPVKGSPTVSREQVISQVRLHDSPYCTDSRADSPSGGRYRAVEIARDYAG